MGVSPGGFNGHRRSYEGEKLFVTTGGENSEFTFKVVVKL